MAKKVYFHNVSSKPFYSYMQDRQPDDLTKESPKVFDNEFDNHAQLYIIDVYGMFYKGGDMTQKPIMYFRHSDMMKNKYRFGNLIDLGDDYLSPQKGVYHPEKTAQQISFEEYHKVSDEPLAYQYGTEDPKSCFTLFKDHIELNEGDYFKVISQPWDKTIIDHLSFWRETSTIFQPSCFIGTIDGEKVVGIGEYIKAYKSKDQKLDISDNMGYYYMDCMGIREDGRKEHAFINAELNGNCYASYWLEGEVPVVTNQVTIEADWKHLPYVDDGTCIYKDAVFSFCGKEIHFTGKWATKGFTDHPRIERSGQSQVFGTWYEGKTPYKHRISMGFGENMEAYDYRLRENGFDVVD